jgi:hypothetical protein
LLSISEFRAATARGAFVDYVKVGALIKLASARFALNEIGAMDVAAKVSVAIAGLQCPSSRQRKFALLLKLERDLLIAGPALDELIARYARAALRLYGALFSRPQRVPVMNESGDR